LVQQGGERESKAVNLPLQILIVGEPQSGRTTLQVLLKELLEARGHTVSCTDSEMSAFTHIAWSFGVGLDHAGACEKKLLPMQIEIDVI
jgi:tRNA uridine 5-carbamoylmethylation protein Kti12